jgi:hypothetical protein
MTGPGGFLDGRPTGGIVTFRHRPDLPTQIVLTNEAGRELVTFDSPADALNMAAALQIAVAHLSQSPLAEAT